MSRTVHAGIRADRSRSSLPARTGLLERERGDDAPARAAEQSTLEHRFGDLSVHGTQAPVIQPKLRMGTPGDKYERQADHVANHLMQVPHGDVQHQSTPAGRQANSGTIRSSRGGPLDPATRESMESLFGRNFGDVRVHTDSQAARSAEALRAQAYTIGPDIVFGRAKYSPDTPAGDRLLAHELTHVVQQSRAKEDTPLIQRAPEDGDAVRDFGFTIIPFAEVERAQRFVEQRLRGVPASDGVQRISCTERSGIPPRAPRILGHTPPTHARTDCQAQDVAERYTATNPRTQGGEGATGTTGAAQSESSKPA